MVERAGRDVPALFPVVQEPSEWGYGVGGRVLLGDLVGRCQLNAPGLPQACWLAATPVHEEAGFFEGGGFLGKVRKHPFAWQSNMEKAEVTMRVTVDPPMGTAHPDSYVCRQPSSENCKALC